MPGEETLKVFASEKSPGFQKAKRSSQLPVLHGTPPGSPQGTRAVLWWDWQAEGEPKQPGSRAGPSASKRRPAEASHKAGDLTLSTLPALLQKA